MFRQNKLGQPEDCQLTESQLLVVLNLSGSNALENGSGLKGMWAEH